MWQAWAIAHSQNEGGGNSISMAIYISVTYIQSPPKFSISAWPYWPPGAVTQQRSDLYNSQLFSAVLFQLVKNVKIVIFSLTWYFNTCHFWPINKIALTMMIPKCVLTVWRSIHAICQSPNWINAHAHAVKIPVYILCIFYIYMFIRGARGECYVWRNGQLKAFMNISRVQGRRRSLTSVNRHHHKQSHMAWREF